MNRNKKERVGDRRAESERREFSYACHIPERRSGDKSRTTLERRCYRERRSKRERRLGADRRSYSGPERRSLKFRRSSIDRRQDSEPAQAGSGSAGDAKSA